MLPSLRNSQKHTSFKSRYGSQEQSRHDLLPPLQPDRKLIGNSIEALARVYLSGIKKKKKTSSSPTKPANVLSSDPNELSDSKRKELAKSKSEAIIFVKGVFVASNV